MLHVFSLLVLLAIYQLSIDKNMENDFCDALIDNNKAVMQKVIDSKLMTLDFKKDTDENFEIFKTWLEKFDCIDSVEIVPGVLRTEPPVKEFNLIVSKYQNETVIRNIGIHLFPDKLRYNNK